MLYAGERYRYQKDKSIQHIEPGSIHVCQRIGGVAHIGFFSGIICEIDRLRLERTMRAMGIEEFTWNPQRSYVLREGYTQRGCNTQRHLWSLINFVDELLGESRYLATGLGLDEQVYRLLALSLFQEEGVLERIEKHWEMSTKQWAHPLDDLVDYIRSNPHLKLTVTDLEEQSHYSARQLQNLFKEKFDCTPMQFCEKTAIVCRHGTTTNGGCRRYCDRYRPRLRLLVHIKLQHRLPSGVSRYSLGGAQIITGGRGARK